MHTHTHTHRYIQGGRRLRGRLRVFHINSSDKGTWMRSRCPWGGQGGSWGAMWIRVPWSRDSVVFRGHVLEEWAPPRSQQGLHVLVVVQEKIKTKHHLGKWAFPPAQSLIGTCLSVHQAGVGDWSKSPSVPSSLGSAAQSLNWTCFSHPQPRPHSSVWTCVKITPILLHWFCLKENE